MGFGVVADCAVYQVFCKSFVSAENNNKRRDDPEPQEEKNKNTSQVTEDHVPWGTIGA